MPLFAGSVTARKAPATIPIVLAGLVDPVVKGIVPTLARPGGNITGATFGIGAAGVAAKWVELVKDAFPDVSHAAARWNAANPAGARTSRLAATCG